MNQLSWLIYLADVANSSEGWFVFFGWMFGVPTIITALVMVIAQMALGHDTNDKGQRLDPEDVQKNISEKRTFMKGAKSLLTFCLMFTILFVTLSIAIPSRDTMYAIAASELGEKALQTPLVGKMGQALEAWLDKQIGPEPADAAATRAVTPPAS